VQQEILTENSYLKKRKKFFVSVKNRLCPPPNPNSSTFQSKKLCHLK
jgi:hypothetical protein